MHEGFGSSDGRTDFLRAENLPSNFVLQHNEAQFFARLPAKSADEKQSAAPRTRRGRSSRDAGYAGDAGPLIHRHRPQSDSIGPVPQCKAQMGTLKVARVAVSCPLCGTQRIDVVYISADEQRLELQIRRVGVHKFRYVPRTKTLSFFPEPTRPALPPRLVAVGVAV